MSKDFWYPWYPALFKADTRHLTAEQDGIYRRLLDEYMETREPLPDNDVALARIAGVNDIKWLDAKRIVIAFFTHKNGMLFHKKCDQELNIQDIKSKRRSLSAEKAAKKRWELNKQNQTDKCDTHTKSNAHAMRQDATDTVTVTVTDTVNNIDIDSYIDSLTSKSEIQIAFDLYNELAKKIGLATAQVLSEKRKSGIKLRLKESGGIEGWRIALSKIEESDFLCGKKTDWKADLDFLITKSKFIGIMEGKYQNNKPQSRIENLNNQARELIENGW